jgi:hypothetical protein
LACYRTDNYDTLVDCPVEMGPFWSGNFTACGIPHRFVVAGAPPSFDGANCWPTPRQFAKKKFASGMAKLSKTRGPKPYSVYKITCLHAQRHGRRLRRAGAPQLHRADLQAPGRPDLPRNTLAPANAQAARGLHHAAGPDQPRILSHLERQAPAPGELRHLRLHQENYTELLWFFEGFTSYYDDLLLRRAGLIDNAAYLKLLAKTINQVLQTPGRKVQSVAQASFDAWVKYYRQDENTPTPR